MLKAFGKKVVIVFKGNTKFDFSKRSLAYSCQGDWRSIDREVVTDMAEYIDFVEVFRNGYVIHFKNGALDFYKE